MRMEKLGDGQLLKSILEALRPLVCPPAERAIKQALRTHRIEYNPDSDEVLSVVRIKQDDAA